MISLAHRGNSLCQSAWTSAAVHIVQVHPGSIRCNETNIAPLYSAKKWFQIFCWKVWDNVQLFIFVPDCQQVNRGERGGSESTGSRDMCFSVCQVCVITRLQCLKGPQSYFESAYRESFRSCPLCSPAWAFVYGFFPWECLQVNNRILSPYVVLMREELSGTTALFYCAVSGRKDGL